ncbi:hypothetical protein EHQ12_02510 [Leptospira gomenensis]|uniref:Uncharacterized protein n=1 Tax=Leptospira gomenensis TaxID=2484974 RepID=A0A5F1Y9K4_9LEPT|nr:hypothetical protein EHQ17_11640 [Leptospira gomenensis]TGK44018.1 hypothetical protein EHQ12_02510 [Leptospira gomenensis]TGK44328.1 hypothetical protein EHQ07_12010 [Leptospira gomenensis]TGK56626.1 hypothetical protein EHQ13_15795 [Leptospira gomenensis]
MYIKAFTSLFLKHWKNEVEYYKTRNVNKARLITVVSFYPAVLFHTVLLLELVDYFFHDFYETYFSPILRIQFVVIYFTILYFGIIAMIFTEARAKALIELFELKKLNGEPFTLYFAFLFLPILILFVYILMFAPSASYE